MFNIRYLWEHLHLQVKQQKFCFFAQIVEIVGTEVLKLDITVFNDATKGDLYSDMSAVDTRVQVAVGQLKVVFLNKFVTDLVVRLRENKTFRYYGYQSYLVTALSKWTY